MKTILNTPMVIALMAFAIVAFLLLIDTSIMPTGDKNNNVVVNRNTNNALDTVPANTNSTTEGTFDTNTNAATE